MKPRILTLKEKKLVGIHTNMSMVKNLTGMLWGRFGPRIKEIPHQVSNDKFSMQVFDDSYFSEFNPQKEFTKWAAIEVSDFENIPVEMESFVLSEGLYAVFDYKGSSADNSIFQYIYSSWIPNSEYQLDNRPHFEVLGEKYKNNDPTSEEEIWIPIKKKS
jgi:AraC family transcriptional regulator